MPNNTWKGFERRISRSYGSERTRGMHGPDFTMDLPDGTRLRAECKKRKSPSGFATLMRWLVGRDVLFVALNNQADKDALVVLRKRDFDYIWHMKTQPGFPVEGRDLTHDIHNQHFVDAKPADADYD